MPFIKIRLSHHLSAPKNSLAHYQLHYMDKPSIILVEQHVIYDYDYGLHNEQQNKIRYSTINNNKKIKQHTALILRLTNFCT